MAFGSWFHLLLVQILLLVSLVKTLDIKFCSPDNTNSDFQLVQSLFQSNGFCEDACNSKYAFAVIQGQNCYCSNYAPGFGVNPVRCNEPCPGYPTEWCGSSSGGLYAYFQLTLAPSGTSSRSSEQASSTPGTPSNAPVSLQQPTVTVTAEASTPSPSSSDSSSKAEPGSTSDNEGAPSLRRTTLVTSPPTSSPSPTPAESLVPSVITVTQNGTTITSTASVSPSTDASLGQGAPSPSGGNPGKIAGIAIGAAVAIAIILAFVFWIYTRRRQQSMLPRGTPEEQVRARKSFLSRHTSQMSQAGLLSKNPGIITTGLPTGSNGDSAGTSLSVNNRYSATTDLRLNPNALYNPDINQLSSVSLQDNHDYSRQLQVRNPDS